MDLKQKLNKFENSDMKYRNTIIHQKYYELLDFIKELMKIEYKKKYIKVLINTILEYNSENPMEKGYYEIMYANRVINEVIEKYKDIIPKTSVKISSLIKSSKRNKGLFADQDIKEGELITFYPIHFLKLTNSNKIYLSGDFLINNCKMDLDYIQKYSLAGYNTDYIIGGHPNLLIDYQNGHMINHHEINDNCFFQLINSSIWGIFAGKNIKKGSELLINYGPNIIE